MESNCEGKVGVELQNFFLGWSRKIFLGWIRVELQNLSRADLELESQKNLTNSTTLASTTTMSGLSFIGRPNK